MCHLVIMRICWLPCCLLHWPLRFSKYFWYIKNIATRLFRNTVIYHHSEKCRDKIFRYLKNIATRFFIIEKYRDKIVHFRKISRHGVDIRPTSAQPPAAWALLVWSSPGSLFHSGWLSKPGSRRVRPRRAWAASKHFWKSPPTPHEGTCKPTQASESML